MSLVPGKASAAGQASAASKAWFSFFIMNVQSIYRLNLYETKIAGFRRITM